jgi:hypothetical protein
MGFWKMNPWQAVHWDSRAPLGRAYHPSHPRR